MIGTDQAEQVTTPPTPKRGRLQARHVLLATVLFALAFGQLTGTDAVSMVHGNPNLGGLPVYGVVQPTLPGGMK